METPRHPRRARARGLLLAASVALLCAAAQDGAPTLEQVSDTVDDYFSFADDETVRDAARERLKSWGSAAVPHLRTLAGEPNRAADMLTLGVPVGTGDMTLAFAIDDIDAPEAIDLLIDIADGKTGVAPMHGLMQLSSKTRYNDHSERLRTDERFKKIVLRFTMARGPLSNLERMQAAQIIGELGWTDATEVVEAMVDDADGRVAEAAAEAVRQLTGRVVELKRPPLAFPSQVGTLPPLSGPVDVSRKEPNSPCFGTWRDGRDGLLIAGDDSIDLLGADGSVIDTWDLASMSGGLLCFQTASGEGRWVTRRSSDEFTNWASAVECLDWEGTVLWRYEPKRPGTIQMALLHGESGVRGIALDVQTENRLLGLDPSGERLFELWNSGGRLASHAALPGRLVLADAGDINVLDASGRPLLAPALGRGFAFGIDPIAAVFPDADGQLAAVAAGTGIFDGVPAVARLDAELRTTWRATLPHEPAGLALLEPPGHPRLFAVATSGGELYVFDEDGAVFDPIRVAEAPETGRGVVVTAVEAGPFDDGTWGLVVRVERRSLLFTLR